MLPVLLLFISSFMFLKTSITSLSSDTITSPIPDINRLASQNYSQEKPNTPSSRNTPDQKKTEESVKGHTTKEDELQNTSLPKPSLEHPTSNKQTSNVETSTKEDSTPSPTPSTPKARSSLVTAKSTVTGSGKNIHITMQYPRNGGAITGTLDGDCEGTMSGNYAGPATGDLTGDAKASCPVGFLTVPVTITYKGTFVDEDTEAVITYITTAMGKTQTGTTTLTFSD